ncbi:hypothetical protein RRG08_029372 [Elysia crispata]|uniref:Uncharacterized protein n=1 Tax=Elysia crispata TaxID=231223 RepID=A0AAE1B7N8_9GAST|nr:hypothetical protein RRG08_029372 [Elysia crispata]
MLVSAQKFWSVELGSEESLGTSRTPVCYDWPRNTPDELSTIYLQPYNHKQSFSPIPAIAAAQCLLVSRNAVPGIVRGTSAPTRLISCDDSTWQYLLVDSSCLDGVRPGRGQLGEMERKSG